MGRNVSVVVFQRVELLSFYWPLGSTATVRTVLFKVFHVSQKIRQIQSQMSLEISRLSQTVQGVLELKTCLLRMEFYEILIILEELVPPGFLSQSE